MKKLINSADTVLTESLDGFVAAHANLITMGEERKFVRRKFVSWGKVALISGGGSDHEPLHAGFVGHGMLDAACPGQVFTSPTPDQMIAATKAVDGGAGVFLIPVEPRSQGPQRYAPGKGAKIRKREGDGGSN
jgi:phosphoenolpyruvate---glycerone phosphotransferase subunit DhaK